MEPPSSWDRLTASLAVADLNNPYRAWAFLVLQGLVRDWSGDRDTFVAWVKQEREREMAGPSLASRVAGLLQRHGLATSASREPDPEGEMAIQRFSMVTQWLYKKAVQPLSGESVYCTYCGLPYDVGDEFTVCPSCKHPPADHSSTASKACPNCGNLNVYSARYCERCGQEIDVPVPSPPKAEKVEELRVTGEIWWNDVRAFRLFGISTNTKEVAQRTTDLWHVLRSVIQDVAVMKAMLQEKGQWDEAQYKEMRERQMVDDHSGRGVSPWTHSSYYPYTLNETEFLKQQFNLSDEEVKEFEKRVESAERLS